MTRLSPRYLGLRAARTISGLVGGVLAVLLTLFVVGTWLLSAALRESHGDPSTV